MRISAGPFCDPRQLRVIDQLLCETPQNVSLRFGRACCLEDLGQITEAVDAYLDVLIRVPAHFGALTNLGLLLSERGYTSEARSYLTAAATQYPSDPIALVNLAQLDAEIGAAEAAINGYASALAINPDYLAAHLGLFKLYTQTDKVDLARQHLDKAYAKPRVWHYPYHGNLPPRRVLLLASAFGGDVVSHLFFDDDVVQKCVLLADSFGSHPTLPAHHVLFNAIGDADRCQTSLAAARLLATLSTAAIINDPAAVAATGRVEMMQRLRGLADVRAPLTYRFVRGGLTPDVLTERGFAFPLLLRSLGHHAGHHFAYVACADDLDAVADTLPGSGLLAIEYLDARRTDGYVRKYRVVTVDGRLYPVHVAIAPQWKVHYFSAAMASASHRAEEAAFLDDMPAVVGERGMRALAAICSTMGLDYAGVDFGIAADGTILVFEANATMAVYPDTSESSAYRRAAVDRIIHAVRTMLVERANAGGYEQ